MTPSTRKAEVRGQKAEGKPSAEARDFWASNASLGFESPGEMFDSQGGLTGGVSPRQHSAGIYLVVGLNPPPNSSLLPSALCLLPFFFKAFWKKQRGFPKFKKKGRNDSFTLDGSIKVVDHYKIQVPKIGVLRTYERLPFGYQPKSVTISRQADRWFISYKLEVEPQVTDKIAFVVGVDLGLKALATLSTGESIPGAKSYRKAEKRLASLQYCNRNKVKGSNNWKKAQVKIAKVHRRVANIRKDTLHKLTTQLAKNHSKVVVEDLNVSGMMANRSLAKAIADMGFYEFRRQLAYKCELYGCELVIADRFFASSKTCSNCGVLKESLSLSERIFTCSDCGFVCDRDLNAALNLERYAGSLPVNAYGRESADAPG